MKTCLVAFWADQSGATALEYGMLAALINLVILVGLTLIGGGRA